MLPCYFNNEQLETHVCLTEVIGTNANLEVNFDGVKFLGDVFNCSSTFSQWGLLFSQRLTDLAEGMEAS